jgi:hypothetical protein
MSGTPLRDVVDGVREQVARCHDAPVEEGKALFSAAMVRLVAARNARLRSAGAAADPQLRQLNAVLSLMASIEFPLAGFHRERIAQVEQALQALAGDSAPSEASPDA